MKKWIAFLLALTLMFVFIGCDKPVEEDPDDPDDPIVEDVLPTAIAITNGVATMNVGDTQTLTIEITPSTTTNKSVTWKSSNETVVKVDSAGGLTALAAGTATITVTSKAKSSIKATLEVTVNAVHIDVASITLTGRTEVEVGKTITLMAAVLPSGANSEVTFTTSDAAIATVDANGKVTGVAEGTVTITATSKENTAIKDDHVITVKAASTEDPDDPVIMPTSIILSYTNDTVEVGWKLQFSATVYPEGADQNVTWHSRKEEVAIVDSKGVLTGVAEGTTYIYAVSVADPTIQSDYQKVTVTPDSSAGIVYPDMQGYVIELMDASSELETTNPLSDKYVKSDKEFKARAWNEIMQEYNCKIEIIAYPDEAPWGTDRINWILTQSQNGKAQADFYMISNYWLHQFASANAAHSVTSYYNEYGKNMMSLFGKAASTYKKNIYALSIVAEDSINYVDYGIFYNYLWLKKLNLKSPAEIFNEGNWTYSTFKNWVDNAQALLGEGESVLAGHAYYYWISMCHAGGLKLADPISVKLNIKHDLARNTAKFLRELYVDGVFEILPERYETTYGSWAEQEGGLYDQTSLMSSGCWWYLRTANRWPSNIWGEGNTEFGYVPFPRPDDVSLENTRIAQTGTTLYMMASQREWNHKGDSNYSAVYRAMNDTIIRTQKYLQNSPTYDADSIKRTDIESKVDDPASVEAAMFFTSDKVMFDAIHSWTPSVFGSPIARNLWFIVTHGVDYDVSMDEDLDAFSQQFISIYAN